MARRMYFSKQSRSSADSMPPVPFLLLTIGFFVAWLGSEGFLADRPHPLHWLVAGGGAFAGWLFGQTVNRLRRTGA